MNEYVLLGVLIYAFCLFLGFILFLRPSQAIEIQRRFYLLINWRVEPVDAEREIRMTRYMGIFMIVMMTASFVLVCCQF
jgi:hypothetical protein